MVWDQISYYFSIKKSNRHLESKNNNKIKKKEKTVWINFIFAEKQHYEIKIIQKKNNFPEKKKKKYFILDYQYNNFRKSVLFGFLGQISSSISPLKFISLIRIPIIYRKYSRKYFFFYHEIYSFLEMEISSNWKFRNKLSKKFSYNTLLQFFNLNKTSFHLHSKKLNTFDLIFEKKKLQYWSSTSFYKILPEISCQTISFSFQNIFRILSLRIFPIFSSFFQKSIFWKRVYLKPFSVEGTFLLNTTVNLLYEKLFDIKEFFNKLPINTPKTLLRLFFPILIRITCHQEFIGLILNKTTSEKFVSRNLLITFKCLSKIQEKTRINYTSSIFYNLLMVHRETFGSILRNDDFFQLESQLPIINCVSIEKDIFFSILNKEKEYKEAIHVLFLNSTQNPGFPLFLKIFIVKILFRIVKKPNYIVKSNLMEILLKIVKRTQIILTKNRKNTQNLKKHFFISLQKCNNSRLLFILKKKKLKGD